MSTTSQAPRRQRPAAARAGAEPRRGQAGAGRAGAPGPRRPRHVAYPAGAGVAAGAGPARRAPAAAAGGRASTAGVRLPGIPFVLLVLVLLGGGLICLLVVNTSLGATSFRISQLQSDNANLSRQEQALLGQVAREQSPGGIERRAYQLGMRTPADGNILDLRTRKYYHLPGHSGVPGQSAAAPPARGRAAAHQARGRAAAHQARGTAAGHQARAGAAARPGPGR